MNIDQMRGESYGTLEEVAAVLKEDPTVRVRIVGHTDADGEKATNLDPSTRRTTSVRQVLATELGVVKA